MMERQNVMNLLMQLSSLELEFFSRIKILQFLIPGGLVYLCVAFVTSHVER